VRAFKLMAGRTMHDGVKLLKELVWLMKVPIWTHAVVGVLYGTLLLASTLFPQ
jgi:hypothetical protein